MTEKRIVAIAAQLKLLHDNLGRWDAKHVTEEQWMSQLQGYDFFFARDMIC